MIKEDEADAVGHPLFVIGGLGRKFSYSTFIPKILYKIVLFNIIIAVFGYIQKKLLLVPMI